MELDNRVINSSVWNFVSALCVIREGLGWKALRAAALFCFSRLLWQHSPPAHAWGCAKLFQTLLSVSGSQTWGLAHLCFVWSQNRPSPIRQMSNPKLCRQDGAFPRGFPFQVERDYLGPGSEQGRSGSCSLPLLKNSQNESLPRVREISVQEQSRGLSCLVSQLHGWPNPRAVRGAAVWLILWVVRKVDHFFMKSLIWTASSFS